MKLYKFRSLCTERDFERIDEIIRTSCFWTSTFFDMNDPMEGVFYFPLSTNEKMTIFTRYILSQKNSYKICSFSQTFENPLLWGHYASGFKGVAIEIDVDGNDIYKVNYMNSIVDIKLDGQPADDIVKEILTTKLTPWAYEREYRFLKKIEDNKQKIGKISKVYFGNPYGNLYNTKEIRPKAIVEYLDLRERLIEKIKDYGVSSSLVKVNNSKVYAIP